MGSTTVGQTYGLLGGLTSSMQMQAMGKISSAVSTNSDSASFASVMTSAQNNGDQSLEVQKISQAQEKTEKNPANDQKKDSDRIAGEDKTDARKTSASDKEQDKASEVSKSDKADNSEATSDTSSEVSDTTLSDEELEEASEVLAGIVNQLFESVLQVLQLSPEEANSILSDMNLSQEDLISPENLSAFTLQAMGAEDSLALLTDETHYEQFQEIIGELNDTLDEKSGVTDLTVRELNELVNQATKNLTDAGEEVAEVPMQAADTTASIGVVDKQPASQRDYNAEAEDKSLVMEDGQTLGAEAMVKSSKKSEEHSLDQHGNENGAAGQFEGQLQQFDNNVQSTEEMAQTQRYADTQEIANQILDHIRSQVKPDMQSLEIQLHPASLGNVQIHLTNKEGNLTANFVAQNEQVKAVLEGQMIQLQERFEEQGIKVTSIEVSVGANGFQQSFEQQAREEQQEAQRPKVRRLRLDMGLENLNIEELSEEDRIAAEMMQANGQTVDLQA